MSVPEFYDALDVRADKSTIDAIYKALSAPGYGGPRGLEPYGVSCTFIAEDGALDGITIWLQRAVKRTRGGLHAGCFGASGEAITTMSHSSEPGPVEITQPLAEKVAKHLEDKRLQAETLGRNAVRDYIMQTNQIRDPRIW